MSLRRGLAGLALLGLAACGAGTSEKTEAPATVRPAAPPGGIYDGVRTRLLGDDLVLFVVEMRGARDAADVDDYARCAAARYTLIRGYGFARHVRTRVAEEGGVWRADAVYTVSPALPEGILRIDAEVTVQDCDERGIPTI
ncbi:hypothetical protein RM543_13405 [Roseicyclus sp. F158]|uniref:Lipoprotein n=1 Tax=Tropicimonas omnivorans TaxID=3075590 RepID=A0ABU3DJH4_9RHOB|nr:hypothetical protein [Roseicyclus sp. F158]MDT0683684.1 hypothetical protein [Roseicyclus sp. F158]